MMLFLDLDGTLIDSNGVWLEVDHQFLSKRGLTVTPEYSYTVGHSIAPVAARFTAEYYHLDEDPEDILTEWREMARDAYAHTIPLKPGALELVKRAKAQGQRMSLLSSGIPELSMLAIRRLGLDGYIKDYFFAHDVGLEKRDPMVYRLAAERFGLSPSECVLIEDAPDNCAAASSVGFTVIGVYDDFYAQRWTDVVKNSRRSIRSLEELL